MDNFLDFKKAGKTKKKGKKTHKKQALMINMSDCRYPIIAAAARTLGWKKCVTSPITSSFDWDVYWTDVGPGIENFVRIAKSYQRVNHFPGMNAIYRKHNLSSTLQKMALSFESDYNFYPKTWILPRDFDALSTHHDTTKTSSVIVQYFIIKPVSGSQGRGIWLTSSTDDLKSKCNHIAQSYISNPLLIEGLKFDLRVYVLVTCCEPLRVLVYKEGLVRLCTESYSIPSEENVDCSFMHLTNYAVNKCNENFIQCNEQVDKPDNSASKRSLAWLWGWMAGQGLDHATTWTSICDIVVKTLIATQPTLAHAYNHCRADDNDSPFTCFEILGFDILLKDDLQPVLLEVNHTPSFKTDSTLDVRVKHQLVCDTLRLLNRTGEDRALFMERTQHRRTYGDSYDHKRDSDARLRPLPECEHWRRYLLNERRHRGNFDLVYPADEEPSQPTFGHQDKYDLLITRAEAESTRVGTEAGIHLVDEGNVLGAGGLGVGVERVLRSHAERLRCSRGTATQTLDENTEPMAGTPDGSNHSALPFSNLARRGVGHSSEEKSSGKLSIIPSNGGASSTMARSSSVPKLKLTAKSDAAKTSHLLRMESTVRRALRKSQHVDSYLQGWTSTSSAIFARDDPRQRDIDVLLELNQAVKGGRASATPGRRSSARGDAIGTSRPRSAPPIQSMSPFLVDIPEPLQHRHRAPRDTHLDESHKTKLKGCLNPCSPLRGAKRAPDLNRVMSGSAPFHHWRSSERRPGGIDARLCRLESRDVLASLSSPVHVQAKFISKFHPSQDLT